MKQAATSKTQDEVYVQYSSLWWVEHKSFRISKNDLQTRPIFHSKKIVDGEILNHITQKIVTVKAHPTPKMMELITKLEAPH
jgi:hypothetical protein